VSLVERMVGFLPERFREMVVEVLEAFVEGLKVLQTPELLVKAVTWSFLIWVVQASSFWVAFRAFGIHVGFDVGLFVNGTVALAVAAPAAPGFIGTFQLGVTGGLGVYGVANAAAVAVSLLFHLGGFIPVTAVGLYYAWRLGISVREVGESETRVEGALEDAGLSVEPEVGEDRSGRDQVPAGEPTGHD
jgi:uncharacterized protein (TIRG00374 family)